MRLFLFEVVVVDFDAGDYDGANASHDIGDGQRHIFEENALDNEENRTEPHEQKCRHGYAVGLAGADGVDGLWKIT